MDVKYEIVRLNKLSNMDRSNVILEKKPSSHIDRKPVENDKCGYTVLTSAQQSATKLSADQQSFRIHNDEYEDCEEIRESATKLSANHNYEDLTRDPKSENTWRTAINLNTSSASIETMSGHPEDTESNHYNSVTKYTDDTEDCDSYDELRQSPKLDNTRVLRWSNEQLARDPKQFFDIVPIHNDEYEDCDDIRKSAQRYSTRVLSTASSNSYSPSVTKTHSEILPPQDAGKLSDISYKYDEFGLNNIINELDTVMCEVRYDDDQSGHKDQLTLTRVACGATQPVDATEYLITDKELEQEHELFKLTEVLEPGSVELKYLTLIDDAEREYDEIKLEETQIGGNNPRLRPLPQAPKFLEEDNYLVRKILNYYIYEQNVFI